MTRPRALSRRAVGLLLPLALAGLRPSPSFAGPSLVLVTLDTTRADHLEPYGDTDAETPSLRALARAGVLFERAYAVAPLTLPSHASILTGLDPPHHGIRDNGIDYLREDVPTLASLLTERGYTSAAFVSAAVLERRYGLDRGFAVYDDDLSAGRPKRLLMVAERPAQPTIDAAMAWLDGLPAATPFFLWVHLFDPHATYEPPPPFDRRFAERPYDGEIAYVDSQLARLLSQPRVADAAGTVVMVVGDHGEGLGEHGEETHGMLAYDATLHVPWIVRAPGAVAGLRMVIPVSQVDVLPTALELLDLGSLVPALALDGRSQAPSILGLGTGHGPGRPLYAETMAPYYAYGWARLRTVRRHGLKLIDAPSPELYDTRRDPGETKNLYAEEPTRRAELEELLTTLAPPGDDEAASSLPLDAESIAKLRSLGYIASDAGARRSGPRPDPKQMMDTHRAMTRAKQLLLERRFDEALPELRTVLRRDAANLDAIQSLALAQGELGNVDQAVLAIRRGLELAPGDAELHLALASLERSRGDPDAALDEVDAALELEPRSVEALLERATVLFSLDRAEEAESDLERALALAPDHPRANVLYATGVEIPRGAVAAAEQRLEQATRREPFLAEGWLALGRLFEDAARGDEAEAIYRRGLSYQPMDPSLLAALGTLLTGGALGRSAGDSGDSEDASDPNSRMDEGTALLRRSLEHPGPGQWEARIALADALRSRGREAEARTEYERVVAGDSSAASAYARGHALFLLGDAEGAAALFRHALELDSRDARALDGLAAVAVVEGEWASAERLARSSIELEPRLASSWNSLAVALEEQGRPDDADHAYQRALELQPGFWEARFNRGLLLRRLGRYAEAAAAFEAVLERLPQHAKSHYELGVLYGGALGRPDLARRHLEAALEAEPDDPRAATIRRLLGELPP